MGNLEQLASNPRRTYRLKSIIFWDMTPCSPLSWDDTLHNQRCDNLKSYNLSISCWVTIAILEKKILHIVNSVVSQAIHAHDETWLPHRGPIYKAFLTQKVQNVANVKLYKN
jgi:hypothetical protein